MTIQDILERYGEPSWMVPSDESVVFLYPFGTITLFLDGSMGFDLKVSHRAPGDLSDAIDCFVTGCQKLGVC